MASECPNPRNMDNVECRKCGESKFSMKSDGYKTC